MGRGNDFSVPLSAEKEPEFNFASEPQKKCSKKVIKKVEIIVSSVFENVPKNFNY